MELPPKPVRQPSFYLAVMLALTLGLLIGDLVLVDDIALVFAEGHGIETASALLLFAGAGLWFWLGAQADDRRNWHLPVILLLMGMREMDFDKRFTSEGILQLRLYTGNSPLWEKAIGLAVIGLILWCGVRLAMVNLPRWCRGIAHFSLVSWLTGSAGILLVVSKSLDGIGRKLAPYGVELSSELLAYAVRAEEVLEMLMALLLMQAVVVHACRRQEQQAAGSAVRKEYRKTTGLLMHS